MVDRSAGSSPSAHAAPSGTAAGVRAVDRALDLLFAIAAHGRQGASLGQLVAEGRESKSTVHRLLATLERRGLVERGPSRHGGYRLGTQADVLCRLRASPSPDLRALAMPAMEELRDLSGETVTLHLREAAAHVVVAQCESRQEIRRVHPLGEPIPLVVGATARAILSRMPAEEVDDIAASARADGRSIPPGEELAAIGSRGYALSVGERISGGLAVSAPILDAHGIAHAALSVSGPAFRFTLARAEQCAPALVAAAHRLSTALGYKETSRA